MRSTLWLAGALIMGLSGVCQAGDHVLSVGGARVSVTIYPGAVDVSEAHIVRWVEDSAKAVAGYLGRFPVDDVNISIKKDACKGPHSGVTICGTPPVVWVTLGRQTTAQDFKTDDVMTHEMVHLALPNVDHGQQGWAAEGLATYVEALARLSAGRLDRNAFWLHLGKGLVQATAPGAERGLDGTNSSKQRYWSGALFWMLADIEIRQKTGMERSIADALRGIKKAGGSVSEHWTVLRAFEAGDKAIGHPVLAGLHAKMKSAPLREDVANLLGQLGVRIEGSTVSFDDAAPLAAVRRSIEASGLVFTRR